jgi:hypothetical protein
VEPPSADPLEPDDDRAVDVTNHHFDPDTEETQSPSITTMPPSGAISKNGLDTATFSKLADAFLETGNPSIRQRIAERLEEAQGCDDALARYHSGHAIKKIEREQPGTFGEALGRPSQQAAKL